MTGKLIEQPDLSVYKMDMAARYTALCEKLLQNYRSLLNMSIWTRYDRNEIESFSPIYIKNLGRGERGEHQNK